MAKQSPAEPEACRKGGRRRRRRKVRRGHGEEAAEAAPKGPAMAPAAAPPRSPREFSSNWKALQEVRGSGGGFAWGEPEPSRGELGRGRRPGWAGAALSFPECGPTLCIVIKNKIIVLASINTAPRAGIGDVPVQAIPAEPGWGVQGLWALRPHAGPSGMMAGPENEGHNPFPFFWVILATETKGKQLQRTPLFLSNRHQKEAPTQSGK